MTVTLNCFKATHSLQEEKKRHLVSVHNGVSIDWLANSYFDYTQEDGQLVSLAYQAGAPNNPIAFPVIFCPPWIDADCPGP